MLTSHLVPAGEGIIEPMIALARCSKLQRIIIAGTTSAEHMFELHRRGYVRMTTTTNCGLPMEQYDVALLDWRERSLKALETTLDWLVDFVSPAGVLIVWLDPQNRTGNRSLRAALERHGLVVEAGTIRKHGTAVSARRRDTKPLPRVA